MDIGVALSIIMFAVFIGMILMGYNVAFSFAATALAFSFIGDMAGVFDPTRLSVLPNRWFVALSDPNLLAVPFFVLMGAILERSGMAERLLTAIGMLMGPLKGGVAAAVIVVGTLLAAATGVVAATVIVMGLLSLPAMVKLGYDHKLATGAIVASGTLAQMLPPSLVLILLAQQMGVGILGLFAGALIPGLLMSGMYIAYAFAISYIKPGTGPAMPKEQRDLTGGILFLEVLFSVIPILLLIVAVLVSIFLGIATPSESGAVGVAGALLLAVGAFYTDKFLVARGATHITPKWRLSLKTLKEAGRSTANISILVMTLLFASTFFSYMFLILGGSDATARFLADIGGGKTGFVIVSMIAVFLLGINLEFLEITFIVVPIFLPAMDILGFTIAEKIWFTVLMAVNLNMAFISPPVGFSLFYLQSVAPPEVKTSDIHKGALPFMVLQGVALTILAFFPGIVQTSYEIFTLNQ